MNSANIINDRLDIPLARAPAAVSAVTVVDVRAVCRKILQIVHAWRLHDIMVPRWIIVQVVNIVLG